MGKRQKVKVISKKEGGITLIALVITIVILIILATVSISIIFGEGGLIDRAQQAKKLTEQAALEEQQQLNSLMDEMANIMTEGSSVPTEEPARLISFSIDDISYTAEEEMTWEEWVNSKYNTIGLVMTGEYITDGIISGNTGEGTEGVDISHTPNAVRYNENIIENEKYTWNSSKVLQYNKSGAGGGTGE